jgi:hypothetical protein
MEEPAKGADADTGAIILTYPEERPVRAVPRYETRVADVAIFVADHDGGVVGYACPVVEGFAPDELADVHERVTAHSSHGLCRRRRDFAGPTRPRRGP